MDRVFVGFRSGVLCYGGVGMIWEWRWHFGKELG